MKSENALILRPSYVVVLYSEKDALYVDSLRPYLFAFQASLAIEVTLAYFSVEELEEPDSAAFISTIQQADSVIPFVSDELIRSIPFKAIWGDGLKSEVDAVLVRPCEWQNVKGLSESSFVTIASRNVAVVGERLLSRLSIFRYLFRFKYGLPLLPPTGLALAASSGKRGRNIESLARDMNVSSHLRRHILEFPSDRPRITTLYPPLLGPGQSRPLVLYIYTAEMRSVVEREIENVRDDKTDTASANFSKVIPEGCPIQVCLSSDVLRVSPSKIEFNWHDPLNKFEFTIVATDNAHIDTQATLDVEVCADDLPIASLRLSILVTSEAEGGIPAQQTANWFQDVFASYARENLAIVRHLKERYEALGVRMKIDLDELRTGEAWEPRLYELINDCDLFQLFWSKNAKKSKFVEREWRHALATDKARHGPFIRPVYWENPMPPPAQELAHMNFTYLEFAGEIIERKKKKK